MRATFLAETPDRIRIITPQQSDRLLVKPAQGDAQDALDLLSYHDAISQSAICVDDLGVLKMELFNRISAWFNGTDEDLLMVFIDGISGSGKTSVLTALRDVIATFPDLSLDMIPVDNFLMTSRGPWRDAKNISERTFADLFASRPMIDAVLLSIVAAARDAVSVQTPLGYDRQKGGKIVEPGSKFRFGAGRKVVAVEGMGAVQDSVNVQRLSSALGVGDDSYSVLNVLNHLDPLTALNRANRRSKDAGSPQAAWREEYPYQLRLIYGQLLKQMDIVYAPL